MHCLEIFSLLVPPERSRCHLRLYVDPSGKSYTVSFRVSSEAKDVGKPYSPHAIRRLGGATFHAARCRFMLAPANHGAPRRWVLCSPSLYNRSTIREYSARRLVRRLRQNRSPSGTEPSQHTHRVSDTESHRLPITGSHSVTEQVQHQDEQCCNAAQQKSKAAVERASHKL
jgi:hypothetical protein